jgi:hypothetical protein
MNAVLVLGWLVIIVFAALATVPLFLLSETSGEREQVDPSLAPSAAGAAMTVENGQLPAPGVQPPQSVRDETAGEEVASG